MGGKAARDKGKRGERQVIEMLQPVVNEVYELHDMDAPLLQRNTLQSDEGGCDLAGLEWLSIEVKFQETLHINAWWAQTLKQAGRSKTPVLIFKQSRVKWTVMMYGTLGTREWELTTPVFIDVTPFLAWFRRRLSDELSRLHNGGRDDEVICKVVPAGPQQQESGQAVFVEEHPARSAQAEKASALCSAGIHM